MFWNELFSFWDMVDFILNIRNELVKFVETFVKLETNLDYGVHPLKKHEKWSKTCPVVGISVRTDVVFPQKTNIFLMIRTYAAQLFATTVGWNRLDADKSERQLLIGSRQQLLQRVARNIAKRCSYKWSQEF